MNENFSDRTLLLLGEEKLEKLKRSHVFVAGLGGVGGYAAEQLVRAGVGSLCIADTDTVSVSNINRQLVASFYTIGKSKVELFAERLKSINPNIKLRKIEVFLSEENLGEIFSSEKFDYVLDAIDTLMPKTELIYTAIQSGIPIVSSMGAGGKLSPEQVRLVDISETHHDGLARMLRKRLHRRGIRSGFKAVFSPEEPAGRIVEEQSRNKNTNIGTISYMPAIFGLYAASAVIRDLIKNR